MNQTLWIELACFLFICIFAGAVSVWLKHQTDEVLKLLSPPSAEGDKG